MRVPIKLCTGMYRYCIYKYNQDYKTCILSLKVVKSGQSFLLYLVPLIQFSIVILPWCQEFVADPVARIWV